MQTKIIIGTLVVAVVTVLAGSALLTGLGYGHHAENLFRYVFFREPYVNRVFKVDVVDVEPGDATYKKLIIDRDLDDRRWGTADFSVPADERLTIDTTPEGIEAYKKLITTFQEKFATQPKMENDSDIDEINDFLHGVWLRNQSRPVYNDSSFTSQDEKDRHPEDLIYYFANNRTACGTVSEAAVAFLRELGFRTRLIRVSFTPGKEVANHVFLEFSSTYQAKWVMFDAMENFIPERNGRLLSAFEFFADLEPGTNFGAADQTYPYRKAGYEIWFNKNGPLKTVYRLRTRAKPM